MKVGIVPIAPEYVDKRYVSWFKNKKVTQYMWLTKEKGNRESYTRLATPDSCRRYIEERLSELNTRMFLIVVDGVKSGTCSLTNIDEDLGTANLGILIGVPSLWAGGIGKKVVELLKDYAVDIIGLNELYLGVNIGNTKAMCCFSKCGFEKVEIMMVCKLGSDKK